MGHTFNVVPAEGFDLSEMREHDFFHHDFSAIGADTYLAGRWDVQNLVMRCHSKDARNLLLGHLDRHAWMALQKLGCSNADALRESVEYTCVLLNETKHAFVPMSIETTVAGLEKYRESVHSALRYGFATNLEHFCSVDNLHGEDSSSMEAVLGRFSRLLLGSGYTWACLPSDGDSNVEPVYVNLDNGDRLLGVAFNFYGK